MVSSDARFDGYEFSKMGHGAEHFWTERIGEWVSQVWGHKKHETWQGLFTDSVGNSLSFPTPTHTHIFYNHWNGYGHLKTADVRSSADYQQNHQQFWLGLDFGIGEDYDF
jgi:hypothetical protein